MRRRRAAEPFSRQIRGFSLSTRPLNENTKQTHSPPTNSNQTTYAAVPSAQPINKKHRRPGANVPNSAPPGTFWDMESPIGAGLCQFNVEIPVGITEGDWAVAAEVTGATTQENVYVTME